MTTHSARFIERPHTHLGRWAVWLMAAFAAMFLINSTAFAPFFDSDTPFRQVVMPIYWELMLLCGFVSGILGLVAIVRRLERSWLVWLTLLAGLFSLVTALLVFFGTG